MVYGGIEHRMWGTLFGRGSVDVEAMADRYTEMVLGPLLPEGRAHSPMVVSPVRSHIGQVLDEVRERLDQIEHAVMNTAAEARPRPAVLARAPSPTRSRRKSST